MGAIDLVRDGSVLPDHLGELLLDLWHRQLPFRVVIDGVAAFLLDEGVVRVSSVLGSVLLLGLTAAGSHLLSVL